ncbi:MAG: hypothetical protein CM15mP12_1080 [Gammaproteobacteria bacterium]|nr:MAG: hypothetical protein CM15mP12_1080 [Gammaproteobacteria bacterium]
MPVYQHLHIFQNMLSIEPFSDIFLTAVIPEGLVQLLLYFSIN